MLKCILTGFAGLAPSSSLLFVPTYLRHPHQPHTNSLEQASSLSDTYTLQLAVGACSVALAPRQIRASNFFRGFAGLLPLTRLIHGRNHPQISAACCACSSARSSWVAVLGEWAAAANAGSSVVPCTDASFQQAAFTHNISQTTKCPYVMQRGLDHATMHEDVLGAAQLLADRLGISLVSVQQQHGEQPCVLCSLPC